MFYKLPFSSVHEALAWYFKKDWTRSKYKAKTSWPTDVRIQSSRVIDDAEGIFDAFERIRLLLSRVLIIRDVYILRDYYRDMGASQAEVALKYDLTDRGIRYIRERIIDKVQDAFIKRGIVRLPMPEEKKYAE